jgi:uncharacterized membrane protein YbjE (DUF340 family)
MALLFFGQLLGGAIGVPIGTTVLNNQLLKELAAIPGLKFDKAIVTSGGATELISSLPAEFKPAILEAYNSALQDTFVVGTILTSLSFLGVAALEWRSTRKEKAGVVRDPTSDEEKDDGGVETVMTVI